MEGITVRTTLITNYMKYITIIALIFFIACNPKQDKPKPVTPPPVVVIADTISTLPVIDTTIIEPGDAPIADNALTKGKPDKKVKEKISCGFGFKKFNNRKRPIEEAPGGVKGKPPKRPPVVQPPTDPPTEPPVEPPTTYNNTIYLDFYGSTISSTMWNAGSFTVSDAGLSQSEIDYVVSEVKIHYDPFTVNVTTDETVFNAAPIGHKIRIVITETYQWFGQAGGVAYVNSFFWTDGSPAFVFSLLLNYNGKNIAEAASHEAGHTLGLRHQSTCVDGVITSAYNWGSNGYAPTMGASYQAIPRGSWFPDGPTPLGCTIRQNDVAILTSAIGKK